ncbi:MAG: hypothetical protein IJR86_03650 [Bacteroidaceae bacterium]|nr:hypothetical protein [Bacteroidaceae bacterium]
MIKIANGRGSLLTCPSPISLPVLALAVSGVFITAKASCKAEENRKGKDSPRGKQNEGVSK